MTDITEKSTTARLHAIRYTTEPVRQTVWLPFGRADTAPGSVYYDVEGTWRIIGRRAGFRSASGGAEAAYDVELIRA